MRIGLRFKLRPYLARARYAPSANGPVNAVYSDMTSAFGSGLYSTTDDLAAREQGLFGGKLFPPLGYKR